MAARVRFVTETDPFLHGCSPCHSPESATEMIVKDIRAMKTLLIAVATLTVLPTAWALAGENCHVGREAW